MKPKTGPHAKIMVVDDDVVVLEVTRERLEAAGYEVTVRDKAFGTSAALLREKPDFVLLDVNMPGLGGVGIARLLASSDSEFRPRIILYSSSSKDVLTTLARECGAVGAIEKTSDARAFLRDLEVCIAAAG